MGIHSSPLSGASSSELIVASKSLENLSSLMSDVRYTAVLLGVVAKL